MNFMEYFYNFKDTGSVRAHLYVVNDISLYFSSPALEKTRRSIYAEKTFGGKSIPE